MLILGLDTCLQACSAALADRASGAVLARRHERMERGQAERLPGMADAVMREAGVAFSELDFVAVTRGPGSFTGVRIGLAFARALGVALDIPVISMTTLEAIARNVAHNPERLPVAALVDARRGELYMQTFDADMRPLTGARAAAVETAAGLLPPGPCLLVGSGARFPEDESEGRLPAPAEPLPDARIVALHAPIEPAAPGAPEPVYLRPPDAKPQGPLPNMGD